jgi:hypothetical protein
MAEHEDGVVGDSGNGGIAAGFSASTGRVDVGDRVVGVTRGDLLTGDTVGGETDSFVVGEVVLRVI